MDATLGFVTDQATEFVISEVVELAEPIELTPYALYCAV
jgi:hypothetical protein